MAVGAARRLSCACTKDSSRRVSSLSRLCVRPRIDARRFAPSRAQDSKLRRGSGQEKVEKDSSKNVSFGPNEL
jgi:hypothetical protein